MISWDWVLDAMNGIKAKEDLAKQGHGKRPKNRAAYFKTCLDETVKKHGKQLNRLLAQVKVPDELLNPHPVPTPGTGANGREERGWNQCRTLFDQSGETRPSEGGADTRFQAAARIQPLLSHLQKRVLSFIVSRGEQGCTDEEIADGLKMNKDTTRPRRYELEKSGLFLIRGCDEQRRAVVPPRSGRATLPRSATLRG